jgi:hypothetical protein
MTKPPSIGFAVVFIMYMWRARFAADRGAEKGTLNIGSM